MDISRPYQPEKLIPLLPWPGFDPSFSGHNDRQAIISEWTRLRLKPLSHRGWQRYFHWNGWTLNRDRTVNHSTCVVCFRKWYVWLISWLLQLCMYTLYVTVMRVVTWLKHFMIWGQSAIWLTQRKLVKRRILAWLVPSVIPYAWRPELPYHVWSSSIVSTQHHAYPFLLIRHVHVQTSGIPYVTRY